MLQYKMLSNGAFRTRCLFKLENLTAFECFLSIAYTVASYWAIVVLLCVTCVRDFCEIFTFTFLKIVERVIWTLEIAGFEQINEKNSRIVSIRGIGTQTDLSLHNETEKLVPTIKYNTVVSLVEKESQTSPSQSSVVSQDFTPPQQNNTAKYDLNVVKEDEKFAKAIITVNDVKASPMNSQNMSQSPVCTIHLTPCSTNMRAKYSKVLVDGMSPEEFSYLRRKWNSLKKSKKRPYLKMQPVFPSNIEDSSDERRPKKVRMMNIHDFDNKESAQEVESPEMNGCYKNIFQKLKSKFTQRNGTLVSYKNF